MNSSFLFVVFLAVQAPLDKCVISGSVADQMGFVLPGAAVDLSSNGAVVLKQKTDSSGDYCFSTVGNGKYDIGVMVPGLERTVKSVQLQSSSQTVNFVVPVSQVTNAVTVTATRGAARDAEDIPQSVSVVTREDIQRRPSRILPDILREVAGIHVQQTTVGQGVAFIHGLMGNRVLAMVDGVRLNNSTFRLGPIQYMGTVDSRMVDRVEVVHGPGSVLYGSDAMGGVINVIPRERPYTDGLQVHGRFMTQFGSADLSSETRAETAVSNSRFVASIGGTFQKFNNLRSGAGRYTHSAEARFVTNNPEGSIGKQAPTGFEQYGADVSLRVRIAADQDVSFVYQRFEQQDVPRFDQISGGNGNLRYQFDPQTRDFYAVNYRKAQLGFLEGFRVNVSYQSQPETRRIQNLSSGKAGDRIYDWSDTDTLGMLAQASARVGRRQVIAFGGEAYLDTIDSEIETTNITSGAVTRTRGRFPRDARYRSYGAFVQDDIRLLDSLSIRVGGRLSAFRAKAPDIGVSAILGTGVPTTLDYSAEDATGSAGVVWKPLRPVRFSFNVARAFRAPNINDFGGIGLTGVRFEIPSATLKPESLISYDFSTNVTLGRSTFQVSFYDSEIHDLIDRLPGSINGQTTIGGAQVLERTNFGKARILGTESSVQVRFGGNVIWGNFSHVSGRNISSGDYLSFEGGMPPTQSWLGYKWEPLGKRYWIEGYTQIAAAQKRITGIPISMGGRFNGTTPTADALDARIGAYRTTSQINSYRQYHGISLTGGTLANGETIVPVASIANTLMYRQIDGFTTLNFRAGLRTGENNSVNVLLENVLDKNYRAVGSGIDAPGINVRVGYEVRF